MILQTFGSLYIVPSLRISSISILPSHAVSRISFVRLAASSATASATAGDSSDEKPLFGAEQSKLYSIVAENHRQPTGPWPFMLSAVEKIVLDRETSNTTTNTNSQPYKILDLASGPGEPASTLCLALREKVQVTASDVSPEMVQIAQSKSKKIPNMEAQLANMEDLPFESNSFDIVTCCYGYMFPENKEKALEETFRVLKPGGALVATTWDKLPMMALPQAMIKGVLGGGAPPPAPPINPLSLSEPGLMESLLEQAAGFVDIESSTSVYDFDMGQDDDSDMPFRLSALPVMAKLSEVDGWKVAKDIFEEQKLEFGAYHAETGNFVVPGNVFKMVVARKPE